MESIESQPAPPAEPGTRTAPAVVIALVLTAVVSICSLALVVVIATRDHDPLVLTTPSTPNDRGDPRSSAVGPTRIDHWHAALGVNDCGQWVPNWAWPPGAQYATGGPARAGSQGDAYAGLHSHGDGIIHMEPLTDDEMGANATLGLYFRYGGWKLSADAVDFVSVNEANGNLCHGEPGVLRWAVNGKEMHGDPAAYKLFDRDVIELVFTTADAPLPPQSAIPSYPTLREILGLPPPV